MIRPSVRNPTWLARDVMLLSVLLGIRDTSVVCPSFLRRLKSLNVGRIRCGVAHGSACGLACYSAESTMSRFKSAEQCALYIYDERFGFLLGCNITVRVTIVVDVIWVHIHSHCKYL